MTIREATVSDVPGLFDVRCSVRENHMSRDQLARVGITLDSVSTMISGGDYAAPVIEEDGGLVAFAMAHLSEGYVFALFVRPDYENRGFGSALLDRMEATHKERGATRAWLSTGQNAGMRAHEFYRARGWIVEGSLPDGQIRYEKLLR